jgi:hypothetical protein
VALLVWIEDDLALRRLLEELESLDNMVIERQTGSGTREWNITFLKCEYLDTFNKNPLALLSRMAPYEERNGDVMSCLHQFFFFFLTFFI